MWDPVLLRVHQKELCQKLLLASFCMTHKGQTAQIRTGLLTIERARLNVLAKLLKCFTGADEMLKQAESVLSHVKRSALLLTSMKSEIRLHTKHPLTSVKQLLTNIYSVVSNMALINSEVCFSLGLFALSGFLTGFRCSQLCIHTRGHEKTCSILKCLQWHHVPEVRRCYTLKLRSFDLNLHWHTFTHCNVSSLSVPRECASF